MTEISEITHARPISKVQKKGGTQYTQPLDSLSISPESAKKAEWVEMLKNMPDIRSETLLAAQRIDPTAEQLAQKILDQAFSA